MEIVFQDATFRYRSSDRPVFDGLDLVVAPGRTILLGPNGAGKSTLLAVAASALRLSGGSVSLGGLRSDARRTRAAYRRQVAWMPQSTRAASGLTVREHVAMHGWLAGQTKTEAWDTSRHVLEQVSLGDFAERKATALSGGQRARMGLAQTLVHGADVVMLDEPTAALDPDQREAFVGLLSTVAENRTVLVSTHDVRDLAESYDSVVVMDQGRVCFSGTTDAFVRPGGQQVSPVDAYRRAIGRG